MIGYFLARSAAYCGILQSTANAICVSLSNSPSFCLHARHTCTSAGSSAMGGTKKVGGQKPEESCDHWEAAFMLKLQQGFQKQIETSHQRKWKVNRQPEQLRNLPTHSTAHDCTLAGFNMVLSTPTISSPSHCSMGELIKKDL